MNNISSLKVFIVSFFIYDFHAVITVRSRRPRLSPGLNLTTTPLNDEKRAATEKRGCVALCSVFVEISFNVISVGGTEKNRY